MTNEDFDQLVKDAIRYRFLRQLPNQPYTLGLDVVLWAEDDGGKGLRLEELDFAIDARMNEND